jgi:hypothetical protein
MQRGTSQGARVTVFAPGTAIFDLRRLARRPRRLITGPNGLLFGCVKARLRRGIWYAGEYYVSSRFQLRLRFRWQGLAAPFDGCQIGGLYGHRWNDAFGTRAAVEVWLTVRGRHFFNDRAVARDLAYFVRSERVQRIRLSATPRVGLEAFARRYPGRVVEVASPSSRAPEDTIGFWIGSRTIVFTATSVTNTTRRFFVVARRGTLKLSSNNLGDLAGVF